MAVSKTNDLTHGNPLKLILGFALPMLLGLLFQQFYSMVDSIFVGKWLGLDSLAAVGASGSINFMIIGFCIGVCTGFTIPVAQQFGAGDFHSLRKYVANGVKATAVLAVIMTMVVCLLCRQIMTWMKTPDDIFNQAYRYIFIIFLGIPVTFLYNIVSGIIRALGDSKTPVIFLIISSVINILLDILSIKVLGMGVEGPAIATVISQGISGILSLIYMIKKFEVLHIRKDEWTTDRIYIAKLLYVGIPMGLQYSITAIGSVILQASVNTLGSSYVAAMTAGSKISILFCCPFDALGGTMSTFAGQNVGAHKTERVKKGLIAASVCGFVYSALALTVLIIFGDNLALLFLDADEVAVVGQVHMFLIANSAFYIFLTLVNVVRFCIQGMGYSVFAILAGICEMIARAVIGFVFVPFFGFTAACFASPLAWVMADLFLVPAFIVCLKHTNKMFERNETLSKA